MEANEDRTVQPQRAGEGATITEFLEARIAEDEQQDEVCRELGWYPAEKYGVTTVGHARTLAECAAKRAILEQWEDPERFGPLPDDVDAGHAPGIDTAVRALASVYKDHPDYRQEWARG